jgi:hypothetical protein
MKQVIVSAAVAALLLTSCRKIEVDGNTTTGGNSTTGNIIAGTYITDKTLDAGQTYTIKGTAYFTDGAKLIIPAGTTIKAEKASKGTLVIARSAQIIANGTANQPIVFTSDQTTPVRGDWGGIVVLGRAKTNASFNGTAGVGEIEGGVNNAQGLGLYGGADDNDNSGILKYVRIEYAGYAFLPDKELNGLTLGAVGRGTLVDHVQVSYANDDSFEWFGGTVDCKYLIAYKGLDDDFDTDNGYTGRVQFAIGFRDSTIADISGSNGFESDNDANGSALTPQTAPVFCNITLVGPRATLTNIGNSNFKRGIHIRRNSALSAFNTVVIGWPTGWLLDASTGTPTDLNFSATTPKSYIANSIVAGNNTPIGYAANATTPTGWSATDVTNYFNRAGGGNAVLTNASDAGLTTPFKYDATVDFNVTASAAAATGADFSNSKLNNPFFTTTNYRGAAAVGDTWWKGWSSFN